MVKDSENDDWRRAVLGTVFAMSVVSMWIGASQLWVDDPSGYVSLLLGCAGLAALGYSIDHERLQREVRALIDEHILSSSGRNPRSVLRERYARGDIDEEEFERRLRRLQDVEPPDDTEHETTPNRSRHQ